MAKKVSQSDLFDERPKIEIELDGVVVPDDHAVYKLFPGKTYRLAKAMHSAKYAFLDLPGLDSLEGSPAEWQDDDLLRIIALERVLREGTSTRQRKRKSSGTAQDKKRLGFLKGLFFSAQRGDLVLVPLGEGFASQVAIGELLDEAGDVHRIEYTVNEASVTTFGRRVRWVAKIDKNKLSPKLVGSLFSSTAFHVLPRSEFEEIYVHAYGTFTYRGIYVAKFESDKETFLATDYANIGALLNGLAVVHDLEMSHQTVSGEFLELAMLEDGSATLELRRNSPISVIVRTVGPLAFTAAVMFSASAEGKTPDDLQAVQVSARTIGDAPDECRVTVPPDVATAAKGFGLERWQTFCRVRENVEKGAKVKSPARLKKTPRKSK